jgi:hypothetical protein
LQDRAIRVSFGEEARRRAEAFSIKSAVQRIEAVYEELSR